MYNYPHNKISYVISESLTPERIIRGSRRLGSVSSAHVPNAAAPDLPVRLNVTNTKSEFFTGHLNTLEPLHWLVTTLEF